MRRREFIAGLGGAAAWATRAVAQQGDWVRRVGVMMGGREDNEESRAWLKALLGGLKDAGWEQPRNIEVYPRWPAGDPVRIRLLAKEIVALRPDVIVAGTTPAVKALLEETKSLPIVFTNVTDPVGTGLVASLARPGGTTSGFSAFEYSLGGIWVQLLKTIAPQIAHVAIMFNPDTAPDDRHYFPSVESARLALALTASEAPVRTAGDIDTLIAAQGDRTHGGLVVIPDTFATSNSRLIIDVAARHRVPAIYHHKFMAVEGGLISYGTSAVDLYRRAASYVDRILRGAKVSELPVQQPTKFELVINLKTAKTLGLAVPETLLATADEVIQ
jgi:putative tryptophan/tyrosine transport system substrate-binding protein